jgi:hypothetical protein
VLHNASVTCLYFYYRTNQGWWQKHSLWLPKLAFVHTLNITMNNYLHNRSRFSYFWILSQGQARPPYLTLNACIETGFHWLLLLELLMSSQFHESKYPPRVNELRFSLTVSDHFLILERSCNWFWCALI